MTEPPTLRSVGYDAHDGNAGARCASYPRPEGLRMTWEGYDSIDFVADRGLKNIFFPFAQMRVGAKLELDILQRHRRCLFADAGAYLVPERCGPFQGAYQDSKSFLGRQVPSRKIGPVPEGPCHLQDAGFGHGTHVTVVM